MENQHTPTELSKFLSLVLRHAPEKINLIIDEQGWADTKELLAALKVAGLKVSFEELQAVVEKNSKQRFSFSEDLSKIRANQGHSISVNLNLSLKMPPDHLFHGTAIKNLDSIKINGIIKGERQFVHLSNDSISAKQVGSRYGKPIVLKINSMHMYLDGYDFYLSDNNVWLTDHVPPPYIVSLD